ncbi:transposase [Streptomyces sp. 900116325]
MARGDLTDAQWSRLEPLLPKGKRPGRPPMWTRRQLIDGIRWRTRTGTPWRDVPERYGPWSRAYDLFRRWQRDGTWQRIFAELQALADAKNLINWDLNVDSTVCRAGSTDRKGIEPWPRDTTSWPFAMKRPCW